MSILDALETSINELMNSSYDKESVKEFKTMSWPSYKVCEIDEKKCQNILQSS